MGTPQRINRETCSKDHLAQGDVDGSIIQVRAHHECPPICRCPHAKVEPIGCDDVRELDRRPSQRGGQQEGRELGQRACKRGRRGFDVWCSRVVPGYGTLCARVDGDDGLDQELCARRRA